MGIAINRALLRSASRIALAAGMAAFLGGCSAASVFGSSSSDPAAGAVAAFEKAQRNENSAEAQDYMAGAAYWGAKYDGNRDDVVAGTNFARNLRLMGSARQAVAAMKDVVMKAPDDQKVISEYGKDLTAAGRTEDAIPFLVRATQMDNTDWSAFSTYGVALDQRGDHESARRNYEIALKLSPANPAVESNVAMSYILSGRLNEAETILRRLVSRPDATAQMRQNLAMVESLKGNEAEAAQLARQDLSAEQANNNLSVLRQMDGDNAATATAPSLAPATPTSPAPAEEQPKTSAAPEAETEKAAQVSFEAAPVTPAPAVSTSASRYQMAPIADDAEPAPAPIAATPATTKPTAIAPSAKPAATTQSSMLRKSYGTPISVATSN